MAEKHWLTKNIISTSTGLKISTSDALSKASLACIVTLGTHVAVQVKGAEEPAGSQK